MRADIAVGGIAGLVMSACAFGAAYWARAYLPFLIEARLAVLAFAVLVLIALAEMPMMILGLRRISQDASLPRVVLPATHAAYVAFVSVYASAFLLLTGENRGALVLAALSGLRFVSGVFVR